MKYQLKVTVETYWNYVIEAENEEEARERAQVDFRESINLIQLPDIEVTQVPDDTPLGDN